MYPKCKSKQAFPWHSSHYDIFLWVKFVWSEADNKNFCKKSNNEKVSLLKDTLSAYRIQIDNKPREAKWNEFWNLKV